LTSSEIDTEQRYLTTLYARLDGLRDQAASHLARSVDQDATAFWRTELTRLESVDEGLCFGRLDMHDGRRLYLGRLGLFRDDDDEPLLIDWRAPAARPFYTATAAAPHGVRRRRRISTRGRTVVALDDELLDPNTATDDGHLVGEAALLAALTTQRTGRMHDIVTTLQAEQDEIIRAAHQGVLVVQGGPGTGKTAVALHRLAYLLYTQPHLRGRGVLVVGPSQIFLDYIGHVLPGLAEHAVVTATVPDLFPAVRVDRTDPPDVATAKGSAAMADDVAAAVRARVGLPTEPVEFEFEQQRVSIDAVTCRRAVTAARGTGLPHNQARLVCHQRIVEGLAQRLIDQMESVALSDTGEALDGGSADGRLSAADIRALEAAGVVIGPDDDRPRTILDADDRTSLRDTLLAEPAIQAVLDEIWPPLTATDVIADLLKIATDDWSDADIPLLDEAAALIGDIGSTPTYGHVVVDEAQELSDMAWRMLMRRNPSRSMTVVGDLAQTGTPSGATSWDEVLRPHRYRMAQLTVNYRTPAEIMAATTDLFTAHHPGLQPPRSVRWTGEPPWRQHTTDLPRDVAARVAEHTDGQLAIITPPRHLHRLAAVLHIDPTPDLTNRIVLLTPSEAKGLEFDSVLIVDPAAILAAGPLGHNDLYVAMTRATQHLGILHPGPPPAELAAISEPPRQLQIVT